MRRCDRCFVVTCCVLLGLVVVDMSYTNRLFVSFGTWTTENNKTKYRWEVTFAGWLRRTEAEGTVKGEANSIASPMVRDYRTGRWVLNSSITAVPYTSNGVLHLCMAAHMKTEAWLQNKSLPTALEYQWVPDDPSAELIPWSREAFCRALNGRNILSFLRSLVPAHQHVPTPKNSPWKGIHSDPERWQLDGRSNEPFRCSLRRKLH
jgi:hypothetical protein